MKPKRRAEFDRWYQEKKEDPNFIFDFKRELLSCCRSDVKLRQKGREVFCRDFEEIVGFNPMEKCITIASACNLYHHRECMP